MGVPRAGRAGDRGPDVCEGAPGQLLHFGDLRGGELRVAALGQPVGFAQAQTPASLLERLDSDIRPSRMKCVALPLTVLQGALTREVTP